MIHRIVKIYIVFMICLIVVGCQHTSFGDIARKDFTGYIHFGTPTQIKGEGMNIKGNVATIDSGGTFELLGECRDGQVIVDAGDESVNLVLNDLDLTCQNNSPILIKTAASVTITTKKETINTLRDTKNYLLNQEGATAVIYSPCDLKFEGEGDLKIEAEYQNGIETKGNMTFESGNYEIYSIQNGCVSLNQMVFKKASYFVESGETAFKAKSIFVQDGTFDLESKKMGLEADTIDICQGFWNIESDTGIIASNELILRDGTFTFETQKNCMEATDLLIYQGTFLLDSEAIGIKADEHLAVYGGTIRIENSQTGFMTHALEVCGGTLNIMSSVDGVHIIERREEAGSLLIQNGNIMVDAGNIGLNIKGTMKVQGGTVYVNGPTRSQSQALVCTQDYWIDGGIFCSLDLTGPASMPNVDSQQSGLVVSLGHSFPKETSIMIKDSNDHNVFEYTSLKAFQTMMISTVKFSVGDTYFVYIDNQLYGELTLYTPFSHIRY